jgi:hypothetical protein
VQRLTRPEHQLPAGKPFSVWFQEHQAALRRNPAIRDWNTIIAIQLLPLFEADPRGWEAVTFLNHGLHTTNDSLSKHLVQWRSQCPPDLRPFVAKLAARFVVKLENLGKHTTRPIHERIIRLLQSKCCYAREDFAKGSKHEMFGAIFGTLPTGSVEADCYNVEVF